MTSMAILGLIVLILAIIFLGEPLYVLIGAVAVYCLVMSGVLERFDLLSTTIIGETRGLADNPVLLAIPFFVLAGALMTKGDIATRLIRFAKSIFGWLPGGLAIAAVGACIFFAAISGSSPVTVIAIGTIMYPALLKEKYPDRFSVGLVTSAGSLGILIPPSIPMIVYAIVDPTRFADPPGYDLAGKGAGVSELFVAGLGPGALIGGALALYAMWVGWRKKVKRDPLDFKEVWTSFLEGFWALMLPVIILGGIYSGLFSPTQAAAVSVVYAFSVEMWIHKSITLKDLPKLLADSAVLMGTLLVIMALALGFNRYLELAQIPEHAVELIKSWDLSLITFLLILNVLLLLVGCLMDILSAILILVPLLAKIGAGLGVHPLHLAVIFIVNLEIGYLTPPVGLNLFVSSTIFRKDLGDVIKSVLPFMAIMFGCLMLITYIPAISLGPVALFREKPAAITFPDKEALQKLKEQKKKNKAAVQSELEDLMDDDEDDGDDSVKSELEDLMDEAEDEEDDETKSELEDLMDEAEEEIEEEENNSNNNAPPNKEPTPPPKTE